MDGHGHPGPKHRTPSTVSTPNPNIGVGMQNDDIPEESDNESEDTNSLGNRACITVHTHSSMYFSIKVPSLNVIYLKYSCGNNDFTDLIEPKIERNDDINPYWIEDKDLKKGPVAFLSANESQFWKELVEKYLYPIDEDKVEKVTFTGFLHDMPIISINLGYKNFNLLASLTV